MPDTIFYLDFDLLIRRADSRYRAEVLFSPEGEATADFAAPFSDLELQNFILRLGRPRRGTRRIGSPEMETARDLGRRLYDAVISGDVRACWRSSARTAERQNAGLRLRLRIVDAPKLNDIPWEYLYDSSLSRFLSLSEYTPLVRYLDIPERIRPLPVDGPLAIVVMISSPNDPDYASLGVEDEWCRLNSALAGLIDSGQVRLERVPDPTLSALQRELRRGQYHILHFIGHGGFDRQTQSGVLVLPDQVGKARLVAADHLATILHDHRSLRLVVLNACEGSRSSPEDPFSGVAQTLVQQGIPAVIAMQFEITDKAAIKFAEEFYSATADGYPVDAALAAARKAIFAQGNDIEWGTPVLYLRAPDGQLFSVNREAAQEAKEEKRQVEAAKRTEEEKRLAEAAQQAEEEQQPTAAAQHVSEDQQPDAAAHVFISYSHQDRNWFKRLRTMLRPVERRFPGAVWSDTEIKAGDRWAREIEQALASATVILLLVSPSFLASDFIDQNELGPVLAAAAEGHKKILWVLLSQCLWNQTAIKDYQPAHDISRPLNQLNASGRDAQLKIVADTVARLMAEEERQAEAERQAEGERQRAAAARRTEKEQRRPRRRDGAEGDKQRAAAARVAGKTTPTTIWKAEFERVSPRGWVILITRSQELHRLEASLVPFRSEIILDGQRVAWVQVTLRPVKYTFSIGPTVFTLSGRTGVFGIERVQLRANEELILSWDKELGVIYQSS
jgi:hypothetical protein